MKMVMAGSGTHATLLVVVLVIVSNNAKKCTGVTKQIVIGVMALVRRNIQIV